MTFGRRTAALVLRGVTAKTSTTPDQGFTSTVTEKVAPRSELPGRTASSRIDVVPTPTARY